jgi:hypothetical protein
MGLSSLRAHGVSNLFAGLLRRIGRLVWSESQEYLKTSLLWPRGSWAKLRRR